MIFRDEHFALAGLDEAGVFHGVASDATLNRNGWTYAPGAFEKSLAAHRARGTMPALLLYHDRTRPAGRWQEIVPSAQGLRVRGKLALDVTDGKEAHSLLRSGAITGLSTGAMHEKRERDRDGNETVSQADLFEISLVSVPANPNAKILRVTGLASAREIEDVLRDAGLSSRKAKAAGAAAYRALQTSDQPDEAALVGILRDATNSLSRFNKEPNT